MKNFVLKRMCKEPNILNKSRIFVIKCRFILAGWQSGYAAACKAVYSGSIPDSASNIYKTIMFSNDMNIYIIGNRNSLIHIN